MKTVKKTSIFPASKKKVFSRLLKLKTLQYVAYPYATFTPMHGTDCMSTVRNYSFWDSYYPRDQIWVG